MMDSLREKVARAIENDAGGAIYSLLEFGKTSKNHDAFGIAADAAIAAVLDAMRDAPPRVPLAGMRVEDDGSGELHRRKWNAMLSAFLQEQPAPTDEECTNPSTSESA